MAPKTTSAKQKRTYKPRGPSPSRPSTKDTPPPADNSGPDWLAVSTIGRNPIFPDPETLWNACNEYFTWVKANPLLEEKVFCHQGVITTHSSPKMRAMTITGMCLFLDISDDTWAKYRERPAFIGVCTRAERIIYDQKFSGAAAELLNPAIIARDLGLADKQDVTGGLVVNIRKLGK